MSSCGIHLGAILKKNYRDIPWCVFENDQFKITAAWVNSLAPGRFQFNFRMVNLKLTLVNGGWGVSYEIALRWMPQDLTDDKSILVQVMVCCCQATNHCLSQYWPRSLSPYGVTRPQWINSHLFLLQTRAPCSPPAYYQAFRCSSPTLVSTSSHHISLQSWVSTYASHHISLWSPVTSCLWFTVKYLI